MSLEKSLRLVRAERPHQYDPVRTRRRKLIEKLDEQLAGLLQHEEGRTPSKRSSRRIRDPETGVLVVRDVEQAIKPWWWEGEDGQVYLRLRYGSRPLELVKGKSAVQADSLQAMEGILRQIIQAVNQGELDGHLKETAQSIRSKFGR